MKLLDTILFYISVPKCTCCRTRLDREDVALCSACKIKYDNLISRNCSLCSKLLRECSCTNEYLDAHYIHHLIKIFRYFKEDEFDEERPQTNALIYSLKRDNRDDVLDFLSKQLAKSIQHSIKSPDKFLITSVPRRKAAIVKYGIDHAEKLGKRIANILGIKYIKLAKSDVKREQKKATNRLERVQNASFSLLDKNTDLKGQNIIIVDDIVTTGASMGTLATLLKGAGAGKIIGATIAIAYKDKRTYFNTNDRFSI